MTVILVTLFFIIMILVELARERSKHRLPHDQIPKVAGQKR
jgi:preprotein translocase subunit SecG